MMVISSLSCSIWWFMNLKRRLVSLINSCPRERERERKGRQRRQGRRRPVPCRTAPSVTAAAEEGQSNNTKQNIQRRSVEVREEGVV